MLTAHALLQVTGFDLVNIQPRQYVLFIINLARPNPYRIPRNSTFLPTRDFNDHFWPFSESHFDLIHLSMITACAVSWPQLYSTIFRSGPFPFRLSL